MTISRDPTVTLEAFITIELLKISENLNPIQVETIPEDVVKRKSVELLQKFLGTNVTVPEPTGMLR